MPRFLLLLAIVMTIGVAGCSNPCQDSCVRVTRCAKDMDMTLTQCSAVCSAMSSILEKRKMTDRRDAFLQCTRNLDYSNPRMCGPEYVRCHRLIPSSIWRAAIYNAQRGVN